MITAWKMKTELEKVCPESLQVLVSAAAFKSLSRDYNQHEDAYWNYKFFKDVMF